jgi:hypothetical protein
MADGNGPQDGPCHIFMNPIIYRLNGRMSSL